MNILLKQKLVLLNIFLIIIIFNLFFHLLRPSIAKINDIKNEIKLRQTKHDQLAKYKHRRNLFNGMAFSDTGEVAECLKELVDTKGNLKYLNFSKKDKYVTIVNLGIDVDYISLIKYLDDILNLKQYLNIKEISLKNMKEGFGILSQIKIETLINEKT